LRVTGIAQGIRVPLRVAIFFTDKVRVVSSKNHRMIP
jgi:hypothetical protein